MTRSISYPALAFSWITLALLAAMLFGGNGAVAAPTLTAAALFLTTATLIITPSRQEWPVVPLLAVAAVLAWGAVQMVPWPSLGNPLWSQAAEALGQTLPATISLNPAATLEALAQGMAYAGTFLAAWLLGQRARTASHLLRLLALSGVAVAAAGLAMFAAGNAFIWNLPKPGYLNDLSATFVNRNTYATFAGLTVLLNLAVALERWGELPSAHRTPWRQRVQSFLNLIILPRWGYFAGAGIALVALMLTHSRAGLACSVLGIIVMVAGLFMHRRTSLAATVTIGLLLLAGFASTFNMLGEATSQRLARAERDSAERATLYAITTQTIYAAPYTGSGLGTFEEAFRITRTPQLNMAITGRIDHAHNTWLQLALELGLPAFALLLAALGWVLTRLVSGLGARRRGITYPALGLGAAALLGTHALVDFSLQIPGLAYTAMLVMGLALAQSRRNPAAESPAPSRLPGVPVALAAVAALAIAVPPVWISFQTAQAQSTLFMLQRKRPVTNAQLLEARQTLLPHATRYGSQLALAESALTERAKPNLQTANAYRMQTAQHATLALSQAPANPYTWHRLAAARLNLNDPEGAASAMAMSLLTGPFEPNLAWQRLPLLARLAPHLKPDDLAFAKSLVHQLWASQPRRTWRAIRNRPHLQTFVASSIAHSAEAVEQWEAASRKPFPLATRP